MLRILRVRSRRLPGMFDRRRKEGHSAMVHELRARLCASALVVGLVSFDAAGASSVSTLALPQPESSLSYVLVDASRANRAAIIYSTANLVLVKNSVVRFLRLSVPLSPGLECCAYVGRGQLPSRDLLAYDLNGGVPSRYTTARLGRRNEIPFMALGVVGPLGDMPQVMRENEHSFLMRYQAGRAEHRVQHCVTGETFHVRVTDAASARELLRYSLPLGMDVQADCTDVLMPPPSAPR